MRVQFGLKNDKRVCEDYIQTTCTSSGYKQNTFKVSNEVGIKLKEELRTQGYSLSTHFQKLMCFFCLFFLCLTSR